MFIVFLPYRKVAIGSLMFIACLSFSCARNNNADQELEQLIRERDSLYYYGSEPQKIYSDTLKE